MRLALGFLAIACLALMAAATVAHIVRLQASAGQNPCPCKSEIKGRQLYASLCQSSSIKGPVLQECLYR